MRMFPSLCSEHWMWMRMRRHEVGVMPSRCPMSHKQPETKQTSTTISAKLLLLSLNRLPPVMLKANQWRFRRSTSCRGNSRQYVHSMSLRTCFVPRLQEVPRVSSRVRRSQASLASSKTAVRKKNANGSASVVPTTLTSHVYTMCPMPIKLRITARAHLRS